jgi:superfamily II DNA or RNA helicase
LATEIEPFNYFKPVNKTLHIFKSLFKGREDIYATRWEKGTKNGYSPAYTFDPYQYKMHRMKGGTFQNYENKQHQILTEGQIIKHLEGEQLIGLYPLLKDNTSWFIAADFDKDNWAEECKAFIKICENKNIPAYLERSRSGKGGHVWIFFKENYSAFKSRTIFKSLLEEAGVFSVFDKSSSFDRLFPNQDYLSGKGFGNLIALPLNKISWDNGNSCFINPDTLLPIENQWEFLKTIRKLTITELENLYQSLATKPNNSEGKAATAKSIKGKLNIKLSNAIYVSREGLTTPLINFIKEEFNFISSEFIIKKKLGKNTWGTDRYFKLIEETPAEIIIPRGAAGKLLRFCKENKIEYDFVDARIKKETVLFNSSIQLKEQQLVVKEAASKKDFGVIVAPPGSGKTIIGLSIIAEKEQSALIIVHRKQLAMQWIERIESFLGIPKKDIGIIGQGKNIIGKHITVAMIQSLDKLLQSTEANKYENCFGTIIVDECHHVPADTFRTTIAKLHSFYLYGLTATPFRKYNDGKLIFSYLGEIIAEIKPQLTESSGGAKIIIRDTALSIPFNSKTDKFETLSKILVHDSARNNLILDDVIAELSKGKKIVIVTERKDQIETLNQYLKHKYETVTLSGEDSESNKSAKWKMLNDGNFQALITTGQYFGEGSDIQNIECLFLVYPFSFEGKLIQYIGRVQRSEITPTIYDYRDLKIDYLEKLFQKRNAYYKKINQSGTLFDQADAANESEKNGFTFEKSVKIPIEQLEFRFGAIAFKYIVPEVNAEIEFEIENTEMRPEFDVLKPYFVKILKTKNVKVDVFAEFENGNLNSYFATSADIQKINREIIDSVKFRFVSKGIIGRMPMADDNLLNIGQIQSNETGNQLYVSEEQLLDDILNSKNVKHNKQLRYLSQKHDSSILKIRFVLSPFSFVFLINGTQQYHIVLETLDTEEATYIWHIDKGNANLSRKLKQIDEALGVIRAKGRQTYIESNPEKFSRIVHDYSDDRKGFVIWKDLLEERIF